MREEEEEEGAGGHRWGGTLKVHCLVAAVPPPLPRPGQANTVLTPGQHLPAGPGSPAVIPLAATLGSLTNHPTATQTMAGGRPARGRSFLLGERKVSSITYFRMQSVSPWKSGVLLA